MTIRHTVLALAVIAAVDVASGAKAQTVESSRQQAGGSLTILRSATLAGQGPVQNILDLLNHRGVETAVVASDVLPYLREVGLPRLDSSIAYIKKLDDEEVHILARQDIASIADLAGKKVNFGPRDTGSFITGSILFRTLRISVQPVSLDQTRALQQLRQGEIAALVYVAKSPVRLFSDLDRDDHVHFLPVPFTQELSRIYLPSRLDPADYPLLIGGGEAGRGVPIATIAVPIVLAVNSRALEAAGNREISQLGRAGSFGATGPRGSSSGAVSSPDLAAEVPGWRRFVLSESRPRGAASAESGGTTTATRSARQPASEEISARRPSGAQQLKTQDRRGISRMAVPSTGVYTDQQKQALYRDYLRWRAQFPRSGKQSPASEDVFNEFMHSLGSSAPASH